MSSSSSSEYEGEDWHEPKYDRSFRSVYGENPFYPTMGQPLIYYTQAPRPVSWKNSCRKRQRNPNCFVKAFRWYTDDRVPRPTSQTGRPDISGFAAWLDTKYEQFMQESKVGTNLSRHELKHTSVIETERTSKTIDVPFVARRFCVKSPWKKRCAKNSETRITQSRSHQSIHYVMQPKDECAGSTCCLASDENDKLTCPENLVRSKSFSHTTFRKSKGDYIDGNASKEIEITSTFLNQEDIVMKMPRDFGCQFCNQNSQKKDAVTQYDVKEDSYPMNMPAEKSGASIECLCLSKDKKTRKSSTKIIPCVITPQSEYRVQKGQKSSTNTVPCESGQNSAKCACQSNDKKTRKSSTKIIPCLITPQSEYGVQKGQKSSTNTVPCESGQNSAKCACQSLEKVQTFSTNTVPCESGRNSAKCACQEPENKAQKSTTKVVPCEVSGATDRVGVVCDCKRIEKTSKQCNAFTSESAGTNPMTTASSKKRDDGCQCFKENVIKTDVQAQSTQPSNSVPCPVSHETRCKCNKEVRDFPPLVHNTLELGCLCRGKVMNENLKAKHCCVVQLIQNTTQTSNHAICLERQPYEYPLFMKIVCADKLSKEN